MAGLSRNTKQKEIILEVLQESSDHLDAIQVFERAVQKMKRLSLATVYRNLKTMGEQGIIATSNLGEGHAHYEILPAGADCHHHLKCVRCGTLLEFDKKTSRLISGVKETAGFKVYTAKLYIEGLCPLCQEKDN